MSDTAKQVPASEHHDFPLQQHKGTGQWAKTIGGKRVYFGSIKSDPGGSAAWERYKKERAFWEAGQDPRAMARTSHGAALMPIWEIADRWLVYRQSLVEATDADIRIGQRTYDESKYAIDRLLKIVNRNADPMRWMPADFERIRAGLGENESADSKMVAMSPATKGTRIVAVRMMFHWALQSRLIPTLPNWGTSFATVGSATKEEYRYDFQRQHGQRCFDVDTARLLLRTVDNASIRGGLNANNTSGHRGVSRRSDGRFEAYIVHRKGKVRTKRHLGEFPTADEAAAAYRSAAAASGIHVAERMLIGSRLFRAVTYLAANTGAYSKDIAALSHADLELDDCYLERKRAKTAVLWQASLWPETVEAIRDYLAVRPAAAKPEWNELVFLSSTGQAVNLDSPKYDAQGRYHHTNRKDILKAAMRKVLVDLGIKEKGLNFGAWRHTFRSLASSAMGVTRDDLRKFDAINRTMAHRIPGSANRYVHLSRAQLKPITDIVRAQLWPDRVERERHEAEQREARLKAAQESRQNLRLVS